MPLKQQKINVFDPMMCKSPMRPYKTSCCAEHLQYMVLFILCKFVMLLWMTYNCTL